MNRISFLNDFSNLQIVTKKILFEECKNISRSRWRLKTFTGIYYCIVVSLSLLFSISITYNMMWGLSSTGTWGGPELEEFRKFVRVSGFTFAGAAILGYLRRMLNSFKKIITDKKILSFRKLLFIYDISSAFIFSFVIFIYSWLYIEFLQIFKKICFNNSFFGDKNHMPNLSYLFLIWIIAIVLSIFFWVLKIGTYEFKFIVITTDVLSRIKAESLSISLEESDNKYKYLALDNIIRRTYLEIEKFDIKKNANSMEVFVRKKRENITSQIQTITSIISLIALTSLFTVIYSQEQIRSFLRMINSIIKDLSGVQSSDGFSEFIVVIILITLIFLILRYFWNCLVYLKILEILEFVCALYLTDQNNRSANSFKDYFNLIKTRIFELIFKL
jgi:hypothetical protein